MNEMIDARDYARVNNIYFDVVITLLKRGELAGIRENDGKWYVNKNQKPLISVNRIEDIHIKNTNQKIREDNNVEVKPPRIHYIAAAIEQYNKDQSGYIYFNIDEAKCYYSVSRVESDNTICVSDRLISELREVSETAVKEVASAAIEKKRYNRYTVVSVDNKNSQYTTTETLEEADKKIETIFSMSDVKTIRVYHKGELVKEVFRDNDGTK